MTELPDQPKEDWTKPPPVLTRVPRVFSPFGTFLYGVSAVASMTSIVLMGFTRWTPPWYFLLPAFLYTFISTGIICLGRIESNRDAKVFAHMLRRVSDDNKRSMN